MKDRITAAKNKYQKNKYNIESTLERISIQKEPPLIGFLVLILIFLVANSMVRRFAGMKDVITLFGQPVPCTSFAGVFAAVGNICVIVSVVFYKTKGFIASFILLVLQFPLVLGDIFVRHSYASIPGVFTNTFTLVAVFLLFLNGNKIGHYQDNLKEQAITDRLTGLPNRNACTEVIHELICSKERFAVVSIDLNNFKSINDTMGHNIGNNLLVAVSARWRALADSGKNETIDFITRQGGDEFTLVVRNYRSEKVLLETIGNYVSELERKITIDDCDFFLNGCFGYAVYPDDAKKADTLYSYADAALYEVKRADRGNHMLRFTPDLMQDVENTAAIEREIRAALESDSICFNLQPQYDFQHKLRGFEALARMNDSFGNRLSPGKFIPVAEKVGLIDKVDLKVFRSAASFFGELVRKTGTDITLSVNVSVRHMMRTDFLDELKKIIDTCGVPANQIEIEITESIMIDSADKAFSCINEIKKMGLKIAIDDFGTGYSSLSYLNKFPADLLKVDKSFIDTMNSSESSRQYVAAIISIGHLMNFSVISEGVEESDQLDTLRSIGCDFIQGYLWGSPLSPEDAEALVYASVME